MRPTRIALFAILLSIGGPGCALGGGSGEPHGRGADPIIGGTEHTGDPAVVFLTTDGSFMCTGSLIAPRVVLTARHCIEDEGAGRTDPSRLGVGTGPIADSGTHYANVIHVETTSGDMIAGNDIAVLLLDAEGSLAPYAWSRAAPAVGAEIVGIGYGQTEGSAPGSSAGGVKFRGTSTVGEVSTGELITAGALSCYGDSGGPGFVGGVVAGVVSRGTADTCEGGSTVYTRVDTHAAMIERVIAMGEGDPGMPTEPTPTEPTPTEPTPTEPSDGGCDPADPACEPSPECDPADPVCEPSPECDPADPACGPYPECDPADPACECDPADPSCEPFGGDYDGDGCPDEIDWDPYTPGYYDC